MTHSHREELDAGVQAVKEAVEAFGMTVDEFTQNALQVAELQGIDINTIPVAEPHHDWGDEDEGRP